MKSDLYFEVSGGLASVGVFGDDRSDSLRQSKNSPLYAPTLYDAPVAPESQATPAGACAEVSAISAPTAEKFAKRKIEIRDGLTLCILGSKFGVFRAEWRHAPSRRPWGQIAPNVLAVI